MCSLSLSKSPVYGSLLDGNLRRWIELLIAFPLKDAVSKTKKLGHFDHVEGLGIDHKEV